MASALAPTNLLSRFLHKHFVHDPGATTAVLASPDGGTTVYYLDMARIKRALIAVAPSIVGGAGITLVRVFASVDAAGATNGTLIRTSGAASGLALRYVTIEITTSTNTDEATVDIFAEGMDAYAGQSATVQA